MRVLFRVATGFPTKNQSAMLRHETACHSEGTGAAARGGNAGSRCVEFSRQRLGSRSQGQRAASESNVKRLDKSLQYKFERRRSVFSRTEVSRFQHPLIVF
jgi:hypothetical protein